MIERFDRPQVRETRQDLQTALDALADEHDIVIEVDGGRFNATSVTYKVSCMVKDEGAAVRPEAEDFKRYAVGWGLSPDDLGREFESRGTIYVITGAKPRSTRYPILADRKGDGKSYKFPVFTVKQGLREKVA